jgi:urease accessory protein
VNSASDTALLRLLQLCSGTLPIGGFTYSQGIEWAVECGWVRDEASLRDWLADLIDSSLAEQEIPLLARLYAACESDDAESLRYWSEWLVSSRETRELRAEERQRGRALASLLVELEVPKAAEWRNTLASCQTAGFALAAQRWGIPLEQAAQGFAWAWLENLALAGVKLIPLGQTAGQRLLRDLSGPASEAAAHGLQLADNDIGASAPALAIASSLHETQYTRLFRS